MPGETTVLADAASRNNFDFLKNPRVILEKIKHHKQTTQRSYIIAICTVLKNASNTFRKWPTSPRQYRVCVLLKRLRYRCVF